MPADLTLDSVGPAAVTYGLACPEHPDATRHGLTQAHATNAVAKHNRDHHDARPDAAAQVNVTAACQMALASLDQASRSVKPQALAEGATAVQFLEALTGLPAEKAIPLAESWADTLPAITAHVAPF